MVELVGPNAVITRGLMSRLLIVRGYDGIVVVPPIVVEAEEEIDIFRARGRRPPEVKEIYRRELERQQLKCHEVIVRLVTINGIEPAITIMGAKRCDPVTDEFHVTIKDLISRSLATHDLDVKATIRSAALDRAFNDGTSGIVKSNIIIDVRQVIVKHKS